MLQQASSGVKQNKEIEDVYRFTENHKRCGKDEFYPFDRLEEDGYLKDDTLKFTFQVRYPVVQVS